MEFFRFRRDIPFMRHALVFNIISLVTFLAAVFFLVTRGLNFSIEFTGGTAVEATYVQTANLERLRGVVSQLGYGDIQVQNYGTSHDVIIRVPTKVGIVQKDVPGHVFEALCRAEAGAVGTRTETTAKGEAVTRPSCTAGNAEPVVLKRSELVGPSVGDELKRDGFYAGICVVLGIITSMFSSVVFSRGLVNLWYGRQKKLKGVAIGQVWKGGAQPGAVPQPDDLEDDAQAPAAGKTPRVAR